MTTKNGGAGIEPARSARAAGLRYVSDERPGITRRKRGRGFQYVGPDGATIADRSERERIRSYFSHLSPEDQAKIFGGTAAKLFKFAPRA